MENVEIQQVKDYWDRRPCNIRHSALEVGSKSYFDEVDARRYFVEPHILDFADFSRWRGKSVLEIGCGIGTDMVRFISNGANYVGTELSTESLEVARLRLAAYGLEGNLQEVDVEELSVTLQTDHKFDLIYSFGVLHHTPDILRALKEIRKVARDSSEFRFMVYSKHSWKSAMISAGLDQPEAQFGCPIANSYSRAEIEMLLEESGWKATSIRQDHIFVWKIDEYLRYEYVAQPWFAVMPDSILRALKDELGWHLLVTARTI